MLKLSTLALAIAGSLLIATEKVHALNLTNSSFETGDFSGWTNLGQTTVEDSGFGVAPTNGNYQAVLETLSLDTGASANQLESFLELTSGSLTSLGAIEGSAIKQTITVNAGDSFSFDWNFLSDDFQNSDYNDFAFFSLTNVTELANTFSPTVFSFSRLSNQTEYQKYTYNFQVAGTYTLGFGVADVGDDTVNSALLVDNLKLYHIPQTIPEPASISGICIAIGLGFGLKNKNGKSNS
ncbi:hypothetical protein RIVM261_040240 [Rivularia sp. IAM M-261]|nr:hypothetical protein RIVM261_040240 [Rivularia sp. IAM M-261]